MRPPRIVILVLFFAACLFLVCRAVTSAGRPAPVISSSHPAQKSGFTGFRSLFSFTTPFTLFPPNAIITIADDNSTSFAARPAAFGPPLPTNGLNGQLWIGSGFTEESMQDGEGEGELGCSDVPGWDDGTSNAVLKPSVKEIQHKFKPAIAAEKVKNQKRGGSKTPLVDRTAASKSESRSKAKPVDDGTDDYLHQKLDKSVTSQSDALGSSSSGHADIQSIQEGAEIDGKIVLLSRGGCGFLEKVKWAQRRGAIALIVGDNQRGGPLIQMYAHGDTSNVTIPSIFTSRTTAYLLSLMMQPGSFIEDIIDENGKPSLKVQQSEKARKNRRARQAGVPAQSTKSNSKPENPQTLLNRRPSPSGDGPSSWLGNIFSWGSNSRSNSAASGSRPPSSGQLDWVLVEDFSDERDKIIKNSLERASRDRLDGASKPKSKQPPDDNFQIGVEDWRDPDLVRSSELNDGSQDSVEMGSRLSKPDSGPSRASNNKKQHPNIQTNGRVTPNSGRYAAGRMPAKGSDAIGSANKKVSTSSKDGLISKIFGDDDGVDLAKVEAHSKPVDTANKATPTPNPGGSLPDEREGLWVIITPSSGASPFFDTLLVLVISPLITLTVVYALLILRARIRRRRWRAPKSVVERLPVRTYHTVASSSSRTSRVPSPTSPSPTTPLLQSQHSPSRSRPRSRTTTGVPSADDLLQVESSLPTPKPSSHPEHEKRNAQHASQWRKYMGRQVECVVCLEEYVDGVSQVMSLPCGHEFHVDCITPWLITRRRTCPICKGDVVRSLARGMPSSPRYEPYQDDSDEDIAEQATSSASPDNPVGEADNSDVEQGTPLLRHAHQDNWFSTLRDNIRNGFLFWSRRAPEETENQGRE
ncbi:uncharacterized protein F4812DRAFT_7494 [Daldinia caldariorum]|uniref:uncharacterized protein n=1 Tax=Daldinia caldariorum TaxID=326644 RepID=UPI002008E54C|nr:uncharacterized protein F4812DRAFT_7494 [Daldinia caldariorum]KAI1472292.1 hypothetical protein F4812DRAFT_7494 [Daldinia caldariorum]